ncbi:hypothetical protein DPMN_108797 [Dreissena polymorpha]|uniref:Uncharacterized protein n=1 Tax=Dreissena polymorpha TaxID=45954 RepID=A0A9D4K9I1_DREPO|nr:hypothetical protein DPMN_108797 [Dreissena polymorpha]
MCPDGHDIVANCLGVSCRCPNGFGTVAVRLRVFCRCIAGLVDFLTTSQTVSVSPAGAQMVLAPSQTV